MYHNFFNSLDVIFLQIQTASQSSPMQAYNQAINDLDKELDALKYELEVMLSLPLDYFFLQFECCEYDLFLFIMWESSPLIILLLRLAPIFFRFCYYISE